MELGGGRGSSAYSLGGVAAGKLAIVLDTAALLAGEQFLLPRYLADLYTTRGNVEEVRDAESRDALDRALDLGLIAVAEPSPKYVRRVMAMARELGELPSLSEVDVEVASLALELAEAGRQVLVLTDDRDLQNLLVHMGIGFRPVRDRGIREARRYRAFCPNCGYVPGKPGETVCPLCGSRIVKVPS
ncbi:MAG: nucleotide-binding protein [Desulfurococcaceae archaeon]